VADSTSTEQWIDDAEAVEIITREPDITGQSPALPIFARIHPIGLVAGAVLLIAVLWHTVFSTERLIGNLALWQWLALIALVALSLAPVAMNALRRGIEVLSDITLRIVWVCAWLVFFAAFFNVVTRYSNDLFEQDILIGQVTSVAWQLFALIALLGLNYGVRNQVNPRIDFWWADFTDRRKAWLDFMMHTFFMLPFLYTAIVLLKDYGAVSLGKRSGDGTWPSGWRVWQTWEDAPDADQLPLGPIKATILVGFVLFALQIFAEMIKTGFVLMGRDDMVEIVDRDEFQRIE